VDLVHRLLLPGGLLHAATDDEAYFAQMLGVMAGDGRFEPVEPPVRGEDEKTDFELKFADQGRVLRAASWRKRP
jgi:tRNA G46 methylase TrmB